MVVASAFIRVCLCVFVFTFPSGAVFPGVHVSLFDYFSLCLDVQVWVFTCCLIFFIGFGGLTEGA